MKERNPRNIPLMFRALTVLQKVKGALKVVQPAPPFPKRFEKSITFFVHHFDIGQPYFLAVGVFLAFEPAALTFLRALTSSVRVVKHIDGVTETMLPAWNTKAANPNLHGKD